MWHWAHGKEPVSLERKPTAANTSAILFLLVILYALSNSFCEVAVSIKMSNLLIRFCNFYFSCSKLEKDNFIENLYIVSTCLIKNRVLF